MTITTETPTNLAEAKALAETIVANERAKSLYELAVLDEAEVALNTLATTVTEALSPIRDRLLTSADIARLNGVIMAVQQGAQAASARKSQLSLILNPPVPPTVPPVAP